VSKTLLVSWHKMRSYYVLTYKSGFVRGLGGAGGTFWLHKGSLTFKGIESHCILSNRREQNSSTLRHTVCDVFMSCSANERAHCTTSLEIAWLQRLKLRIWNKGYATWNYAVPI